MTVKKFIPFCVLSHLNLSETDHKYTKLIYEAAQQANYENKLNILWKSAPVQLRQIHIIQALFDPKHLNFDASIHLNQNKPSVFMFSGIETSLKSILFHLHKQNKITAAQAK